MKSRKSTRVTERIAASAVVATVITAGRDPGNTLRVKSRLAQCVGATIAK